MQYRLKRYLARYRFLLFVSLFICCLSTALGIALVMRGSVARIGNPAVLASAHVKTAHTDTTVTATPITNRGLPATLLVPKLGINTAVRYMGRTTGGAMAVPSDVISTGWYKYGALPGNIGTAVIAGHLDDLRGQPGVFSRLAELQTGDTISVVDTSGRTAVFAVRATQLYDARTQPTEVFSSSDQLAHLNLITCGGPWDKTTSRYQKRLVVFTDRID